MDTPLSSRRLLTQHAEITPALILFVYLLSPWFLLDRLVSMMKGHLSFRTTLNLLMIHLGRPKASPTIVKSQIDITTSVLKMGTDVNIEWEHPRELLAVENRNSFDSVKVNERFDDSLSY
ncbi:hypothetical protein OUZ56_023116 [Daphnia magna]|uniref:Uncharacterized protein n=1 Tax=Daphnia magna TaxID=35525 RepID=A0ABR0AYG5_9CRUS|nr:hypothetical protein OUZ56_023116 [Daphnia magna]